MLSKSIKNLKSKFSNFIYFISFSLLTISSLSQYRFGAYFLTADYGCYSFNRIYERILIFNLNEKITKVLTILLTPIIHFFLDLGAREGVYQFCVMVPDDLASSKTIHISTMIFFIVLHLFLFIKIFRWSQQQGLKNLIKVFIPFSILIPTLYASAHLRYLIPLIPFLMLFLFLDANQDSTTKLIIND